MNKNLGQVFTPQWIVEKMIKDISLLEDTILEPSCGDGAFLTTIVKSILNLNISNEHKKQILENNIEAFELDTEIYNQCINNLNSIVNLFGFTDIKWNIHNEDTLKHDFKDKKYSYIIGNPPYIRLHNIDVEYRKFLKDNFKFCKGTTDIYLAFYELCLRLLAQNGTLKFITPNSFMRNVGFKDFREYIYKNKLLRDLKDFKSSKIFSAATYCAIMTLTLTKNENFIYEEYDNENLLYSLEKPFNFLNTEKWVFTNNENEFFLNSQQNKGFNVNVQYGLATLRDKIYITSDFEKISDTFCKFKDYIIETDLIKPIIKGSKVGRIKKEEYCIFPYKETENGLKPLTEQEMAVKYPRTYLYFLDNKEELLKRDIDKNYISWFQYGRSQGIRMMINEKIIVDPIVNPNGKVICSIADKNTLVYSGIFITGNNLEEVQKVISSPDFVKYASINGKDMQGGFKSLTTKVIKNFIE